MARVFISHGQNFNATTELHTHTSGGTTVRLSFPSPLSGSGSYVPFHSSLTPATALPSTTVLLEEQSIHSTVKARLSISDLSNTSTFNGSNVRLYRLETKDSFEGSGSTTDSFM